MPKISVVIPNYNHERFLELRIESVLNQIFQDFEVILLDDCSTDNSSAIIERYRGHPKVSEIYYNTNNSGSTFSQWEKGIHLAQGEWLWIAESDDYASPGFLSELIKLTHYDDSIGIAFCNSRMVDDDQKEREMIEYMNCNYKNGIEEVRDRLCHFNTITNVSSCLIKRTVALWAIKGLGKYKTCGDWLFYARALQYSNLAYTPQKLNYYRWHAGNVSYTASKSGAYIIEGINVLSYIDYNIVQFSSSQFISLIAGWAGKLTKIKPIKAFKPMLVLIYAVVKFGNSRLNMGAITTGKPYRIHKNMQNTG